MPDCKLQHCSRSPFPICDQKLFIIDIGTVTSPPSSGAGARYKRYRVSLRLDSARSSSLPLRHSDDHLTCFTETEGERDISWEEWMARETAQVGGREAEVADNY